MEKPLAFVIMPFSAAISKKNNYPEMDIAGLDTVYAMISKVIGRKYDVKRAESPTDILRDIILDLDKAELVIADLTSLNPNVMYELGIRHGFCKKTIMITQDRSELPFDIAGYQCIEYKWITEKDKTEFRKSLLNILDLLEKHDDPRHGPVHTHLGIKSLGIAHYEKKAAIRKLKALFQELGFVVSSLALAADSLAKKWPDAVSIQKDNPFPKIDLDKLSADGKEEMFALSRLPEAMSCVDLFVAENYIPEIYDQNGNVSELISRLLTLKTFRYHGERMTDNPLLKVSGLISDCMERVAQILIAMEGEVATKSISEIDISEYPEILAKLRL